MTTAPNKTKQATLYTKTGAGSKQCLNLFSALFFFFLSYQWTLLSLSVFMVLIAFCKHPVMRIYLLVLVFWLWFQWYNEDSGPFTSDIAFQFYFILFYYVIFDLI
jgi:hypothetical protein